MAAQYKTFVSGNVLTAAEVNNYLMRQAVIVCDSSADYPTSPTEGMMVWDKGLDSILTYTGANWRMPWNHPWGVVKATAGGTSGYGYVRLVSSAQSGISSATDITNATVTFTAIANRIYRVQASADLTASTTGGWGQIQVLLDGTAIATSVIGITTASAGNDRFALIDTSFTTTAGSKTLKLQGSAGGVSGLTMTVQHATATPTTFVVQDIGPAGATA